MSTTDKKVVLTLLALKKFAIQMFDRKDALFQITDNLIKLYNCNERAIDAPGAVSVYFSLLKELRAQNIGQVTPIIAIELYNIICEDGLKFTKNKERIEAWELLSEYRKKFIEMNT